MLLITTVRSNASFSERMQRKSVLRITIVLKIKMHMSKYKLHILRFKGYKVLFET